MHSSHRLEGGGGSSVVVLVDGFCYVWFAVDFVAPIAGYFDGIAEAQAAVDVAAWRGVYDYIPHLSIS